MLKSRNQKRIERHSRILAKINKHMNKFRLVVFRSNKNIEAQIIDDVKQKTLVYVNSKNLNLKKNNIKTAEIVGKKIAELCSEKKIINVVFDRSGYMYHGKIKALAEAARNGGLVF